MAEKPQPSPAELEILQILWDKQPNTIGAIHDIISQQRDVGYTTVLKQVQRMEKKGLVKKARASGRAHLYRAAYSDETTKRGVFRSLLDKAFGGSVSGFVTFALGEEELTQDEIRSLKKLLDDIEE